MLAKQIAAQMLLTKIFPGHKNGTYYALLETVEHLPNWWARAFVWALGHP
jgi:hypothetical protein